MENKDKRVRVKTMCLFLNEGKVLVGVGQEKTTGQKYYRVLGGSLNALETSETGIRREIKEELRSEIDNLELLEVIENIFEFEGQKGDEVVFLYKGNLIDKNLYTQEKIHVQEENYEMEAHWVPVSDVVDGKVPLYPVFDYKKLLIK